MSSSPAGASCLADQQAHGTAGYYPNEVHGDCAHNTGCHTQYGGSGCAPGPAYTGKQEHIHIQ